MFSDKEEYELIKAFDQFTKENEREIRLIMDEFEDSLGETISFILKKGTKEIIELIKMSWNLDQEENKC